VERRRECGNELSVGFCYKCVYTLTVIMIFTVTELTQNVM